VARRFWDCSHVWGVMSTFGHIAQQGSATMAAMAPGVSAALITTVAGLLVAIPSMFGYNWLVHNLRVLTVELDNFAQEIVSKMKQSIWKIRFSERVLVIDYAKILTTQFAGDAE